MIRWQFFWNKRLILLNIFGFRSLYPNVKQSQENKIKCLVHYFERVCLCTPTGFVSFERKVLPLEQSSVCTCYPDTDFWSKSTVPLCSFEVKTRVIWYIWASRNALLILDDLTLIVGIWSYIEFIHETFLNN